MLVETGTVLEIQMGGYLWLACPDHLVPAPGQYLSAWNPADLYAPLPAVLFLGGLEWLASFESDHTENYRHRVRVSSPISDTWDIGTELQLRGPFGQGFRLPKQINKLALICLGSQVERLMPLVNPILEQNGAVALFTDSPLPQLPIALEAYPLEALADLRDWPDFMAFDIPAENLPQLREILKLSIHERLKIPAQVLASMAMPCAGIGSCGACAVEGRGSYFLTCEDGPVFDLARLDW